jgi:4-alpha-glucanotransferase
MTSDLDRVAAAYGLEADYVSAQGKRRRISEETQRRLLRIMGVTAPDRAEHPAVPVDDSPTQPLKCFVPPRLRHGRAWGITCQLYGLRSRRNWGIGDFEDLARLAEIVAAQGGDFIGVSPVHALFPAAPERYSPYSPSTRRGLNVLHIAPDVEPEFRAMPADARAERQRLAEADLVDYPAVARAKLPVLEAMFRRFEAHADADRRAAFAAFRRRRGESLELACLFDALDEHMTDVFGEHRPFWQWREPYRTPGGTTVRRFAETHDERVRFFAWLQWLADRQLARAQDRALAAGMRIGLYLDHAVGVTADGAMAWSDRDLMMRGAQIGAPPDALNPHGQDWGLIPYSPVTLVARDFEPLRDDLATSMAHAGAVRLDHAMALRRLFWVPAGETPEAGGYVRYPFRSMLREVAVESRAWRCLVIGEALGTVPEGFVATLAEAELQAYRVLFFERRRDGCFRHPRSFPRRAFACVSTHDLPTLQGWWQGRDIDWQERLGFVDEAAVPRARAARVKDRGRLLEALGRAGLSVALGSGASALPVEGVVAVHRYVAMSPARLCAVQLEDALGEVEQANVPGPTEPHPNWRRRPSTLLEDLGSHELFEMVCAAMRRDRPRP